MRKQQIIILLCSCFFLFVLSGFATAEKFGPYMGKVVDGETEEPIEGAVVFMKIMTVTPNVGGAEYHFADATEVLTDSNGEFIVELKEYPLKPGHFWWPDARFIIFKPGFGAFPSHAQTSVDVLKKNTSSIFPEETYVTIKLPKLRSKKEQKRNISRMRDYDNPDIPYEKRKMLFKMVNEEYAAIGLKTLPPPLN